MKILVVGGGSGGHITPAMAVVREILELKPRSRIEFWTDRKYYKNVVKITTEIGMRWGGEIKTSSRKAPYIRVRKVMAGKFQRFANRKSVDYLTDIINTLKVSVLGNLMGFLGFLGGLLQAFLRLAPKAKRPDVIFLKGGFVGLPVGLVARWYRIPYVVHESDAVPGLANRILMKRASVVAMGVPFETPQMDDNSKEAEKLREERKNWEWVGIPVAPEFKVVTEARKKSLKKACGFDTEKPLVMVTGGSQGSQHIDEAIRKIVEEMLKFTSVGLVAGRKHYEAMIDLKKYEEWEKAELKSNFRMWNFSPVMYELMGAADVVVSRAGATTIAELAALKKAVILIPFEKLPGGHQVKNAERLKQVGAAEMIVDEQMVEKPELLLETVRGLVRSRKKREELADNLHRIAKVEAAKNLADIIIRVGTK